MILAPRDCELQLDYRCYLWAPKQDLDQHPVYEQDLSRPCFM